MYPVIFRLGPLTVHSYGVMLAIAFLIGLFLSIRRAKAENIAPSIVVNLSVIILISGLIGARIFFILINLEYFLSHPSEIIMLHRGGLAFFGGLALASLSGFLYLRKVGPNPWKIVDLIIPYVVLGESIVRIGCFLNGCCYGTPTDLPWAVSFPPLSAAYAHFGSTPLHPAQLYQAAANFVIFLLLLRSRRRYDGEIFLIYLLLYALSRFFIGFLRGGG
ncbi:prolipoprotein diacylglyceryl transferase [candidate division NPL-UPA2 bacterium Unc8]|uniref:Phosphatidylglycerol--prolipoprotein diacylglyceryl transferase n=1 Tax=candidate division NPL-UPA2 bacterium Unc8 TaxID=1980939 RepID=A0A399G136_UNCN2|nr:Prolipoprotein diacylglyceryl transferase [Bacillota bacterium]MBT9146389.1 Prolipoprotein diacylglyceryl transferase [Bacillota bacterium]RII01083.1 MAG: prolipoprotein diacylglyceryl transferase [candidate division NPL-UPA2 bacterium Unc8]